MDIGKEEGIHERKYGSYHHVDISRCSSEIRLVTDASDTSGVSGITCNKRWQQSWQPLTFWSKMLIMTQTKYNPYNRELLAIYTAIQHLQHILKGREFSVDINY